VKVVKNAPVVTRLNIPPGTLYTFLNYQLSATVARGISGSGISKILWDFVNDNGMRDTATTGTSLAVRFSSAGRKSISLIAVDSLGDSSAMLLDSSIIIQSGRPALQMVSILPRPDSVSTRVTMAFKYRVSDANGLADSIYYRSSDTALVFGSRIAGSDSTIRMIWTTGGTKTFKLWAKHTANAEISDTVQATFVVVKNTPAVTGMAKPAPTLYTRMSYGLQASSRRGFSRSRITGYFWDIPNDASVNDTMTQDSTWRLTFSTPGVKRISVFVRDSLGDSSAAYLDSLTIDAGRPEVRSLSLDTLAAGIFINDPIKFTVTARDTNGTVAAYRVVLRNQSGTDSLVSTGAASPLIDTVPAGKNGIYTVNVYAQDNEGLWSNAYAPAPQITVRAGTPRMDWNFPTSLWAFDSGSFTGGAYDTNGTINRLVFDWDDGSKKDTLAIVPAAQSVSRVKKHLFSGDGLRHVSVSAIDDDSLVSSRTVDVRVNMGRPRVTALRIQDSLSSGMYMNDAMRFTISAFDSNGAFSRYRFIFRKSGGADSVIERTDSVLTFVFPLGSSGTYTIKYQVRDDDSIWSLADSVVKTVKPGTPSVTGLLIQDSVVSGSYSGMYVNDWMGFTISATDPNGSLAYYRLVFKKVGATDSMELASAASQYTYPFPRDGAGTYTIKYQVRDDDGLWSAPDSVIKIVKKGMPRVQTVRDTQIIQDADYYRKDTIYLEAAPFDSNGTIQKYWWVFSNPLDTTHFDTVITTTNYLRKSMSSSFWNDHYFYGGVTYTAAVFGKDDDGFVAGDTFCFYYDWPREHADSSIQIVGYKANQHWWEWFVSSDSIHIDITPLNNSVYDPLDTSFTEVKVEVVVDSSDTLYGATPIYWNTSHTLLDWARFQQNFTFDETMGHWRHTWRPPGNYFSAYRLELFFHFRISVRNRAGIVTVTDTPQGHFIRSGPLQ
jgi:hypothetical protein